MAGILNGFSHLEHTSRAPAKAKAFYQQLFDWKMTDQEIPDHGTRTEVKPEHGPDGAIAEGGEGAPTWTVYVNVTDLETTVKKAQQLGGTLVHGPLKIPHAGALAVIVDPAGATFKLWQDER